MTQEMKDKFTSRIGMANRSQMIVVVYDITLEYIDEALSAHTDVSGDEKKRFSEAVKKAENGIHELMNALNFDYEIADCLMSVYVYVQKRLMISRLNRDKDVLEEVKVLLQKLRNAFEEISGNDSTAALINTTRHVAAGLTYGKGVLNESVLNAENAREFSV